MRLLSLLLISVIAMCLGTTCGTEIITGKRNRVEKGSYIDRDEAGKENYSQDDDKRNPLYGGEQKRQNTKKKPLSPAQVEARLGHGGPYDSLGLEASHRHKIESDHSPASGLLSYVNINDPHPLPDNLKHMVQNRLLFDELNSLDKSIKNQAIKDCGDKEEYGKNRRKIAQLKKDRKNPELTPKKIEDIDTKINALEVDQEILINKAKDTFLESQTLSNEWKQNVERYKQLNDPNAGVETKNTRDKGMMATLSIPYELHRHFPTTGKYPDDITLLKHADADKTQILLEEKQTLFKETIDEGIRDKIIKKVETTDVNGNKVTDYKRTWEACARTAYEKGTGSPPDPFFKELKQSQRYYFLVETISMVKTPTSENLKNLIDLYINEYKTLLGADFERYKQGLGDWLETNKNRGWINAAAVEEMKTKHLQQSGEGGRDTADQNAWEAKNNRIKKKADAAEKTFQDKPKDYAPADDIFKGYPGAKPKSDDDGSKSNSDMDVDSERSLEVPSCTGNPNGRRKRDTSTCIFRKKDSTDPSDGEKVLSVDAENLNRYMVDNSVDPETRSKVVEEALKSKSLLTGDEAEVTKSKQLLAQAQLDRKVGRIEKARQMVGKGSSKLKTSLGRIQDKLKITYDNVKVSGGKLAAKLSGKVGKAEKLTGPAGKLMLGKSVVTAIRHGDTGSLVFMGTRFAQEYIMEGAGKLAAKKGVIKGVTKVVGAGSGKFAKAAGKFLGKAAGPVGAALDIGYNIYNIANRAKILNNSTVSKFDKNDAIYDNIADYIDIGVTAVAAVVTCAFPPLAPVVALGAFVINIVTTVVIGMFKAANHVDRLNSQIPLLDFEEVEEFERSFIGRSTSAYIEDLIMVKEANNAVVNATVQILKANKEEIGRVFPARSLHQTDAECILQRKTCVKVFGLIQVAGCENFENLASCDGLNGPCDPRSVLKFYVEREYPGQNFDHVVMQIDFLEFHLLRKDKSLVAGKTCGYGSTGLFESNPFFWMTAGDENDYRCRCGPEPPPLWLHEVKDSLVDFRSRRNVYLQRSSPDHLVPPEFEYLCKPSSVTFEGSRISKSDLSLDFLCEGAIGLRRRNGEGNYTVYDLREGKDSIYLNERSREDSLFLVEDGEKVFVGSGGDDTFQLQGNCSSLAGVLDGGGFRDRGNTLVLGSQCGGGDTLIVDLVKEEMRNAGRNIQLGLKGLTTLVGREGKPEKFVASCSTRLIQGGGGSRLGDPDVVSLPKLPCPLNLTLIAWGATRLESDFQAGSLTVVVLNKGRSSFEATFSKYSSDATISIQVPLESGVDLESGVVEKAVASSAQYPYHISLRFHSGMKLSINLDKEFLVSKPEEEVCGGDSTSLSPPPHLPQIILLRPGYQISLVVDLSSLAMSPVIFLHDDGKQGGVSSGIQFLPNTFHMYGSGLWEVVGGGKDDVLDIHQDSISGSINGNAGSNSLSLTNLPTSVDVTIDAGMNLTFSTSGSLISLSQIQNFFGRKDGTETIVADCSTKMVALRGGGDTVIFPNRPCPYFSTVLVEGNTKIVNEAQEGQVVVRASLNPRPNNNCGTIQRENLSDVHLTLSSQHGDQSRSILLLDAPGSQLSETNASGFSLSYENGQNLTVALEGDSFPVIQLSEDEGDYSVLAVTENRNDFVLSHTLSKSNRSAFSIRIGATGVSNTFHLLRGSWKAVGGDKDDQFSLDQGYTGSFHGGGGENTLFLLETFTHPLAVDINEMKVTHGSTVVSFSSIQNVQGRKGLKETVICGCDTRLLALQGGGDEILIPNDCSNNQEITILATGSTHLVSKRSHGNVAVHLLPNPTNLTFNAEMDVFEETSFQFFMFLPTKHLRNAEVVRRDGGRNLLVSLGFRLGATVRLNMTIDPSVTQGRRTLNQVSIEFQLPGGNGNEGNLLIDQEEGTLRMLHVLDTDNHDKEGYERWGAPVIPNIFSINSGHWVVKGGGRGNTFVINGDSVSGSVEGHGKGNTLVLSDRLESEVISVDLGNRTLSLRSTHLRVENVQAVIGRENKSDELRVACGTEFVKLNSGTADHPDVILITAFCNSQLKTHLGPHTIVSNEAVRGDYAYLMESPEFEISYEIHEHLTHNFTFLYSPNLIDWANISIDIWPEGTLWLKLSNQTQSFPLNLKKTMQPTFQFATNGFVTDLHFEDQLLTTSTWVSSGYEGDVVGIWGADNNIVVDSVTARIGILSGGNKDNNFFIQQVTSIDTLECPSSTKEFLYTNSLILGIELFNDSLTIDLIDGSLEETRSGKVLISSVTCPIQKFRGRSSRRDILLPSCGITDVDNVQALSFTDLSCTYNTRIHVSPGMSVSFSPPEDSGTVYLQGDFFYTFSSPSSLHLQLSEEIIGGLSLSSHKFFWSFNLTSLEDIGFDTITSQLTYTVGGSAFSHSVGGIGKYDEFYSQPEFITNDNFALKIGRYGDLMFVSHQDTRMTESVLRRNLVPALAELCSRLNVGFLVKYPTALLSVENGPNNETTILTTGVNVSNHMVGQNSVSYEIVDLGKDAIIYPYPGTASLQLIDMTQVIYEIRTGTGVKYVPSVRVEGLDLVISMEGHRNTYPGVINIVNGVEHAGVLKILLNSAVMEMIPATPTGRGLKREVGERETSSSWAILPVPLLLPPGAVYVLSMEDIEDGTRFSSEEGKDTNIHYTSVRDGKDLIVTSLNNETDFDSGTTLVIQDFFAPVKTKGCQNCAGPGDGIGALHALQGVSISLGDLSWDNVTTENQSLPANDTLDYVSLITQTEEDILSGIPATEVERTFLNATDEEEEEDIVQYSPPNCPSDMFQCGTGRCLSLHQICDSRRDCQDGEDEEDCYKGDGNACTPFGSRIGRILMYLAFHYFMYL